MRAFLAAGFVPPARAVVAAAQEALRPSAGPAWRFGPADQAHLTLLFLGEIDRALVLPATHVLAQAAAGVPSFRVTTSGWGAFPDASRARVAWLGFPDAEGALLRLVGRLKEALAGLPVRLEDRPFTPHLTLARLAGEGRPADLRAAFARAAAPPPAVLHVSEVVFHESRLERAGAVHTVLARLPLGV